jgi:S-formylglutathione hydrolase FrmB
VNRRIVLGPILLLLLVVAPAEALTRHSLRLANRRLAGQVLDYTNHHGHDNRLWSAALCERRSVYIYLPPCFDPAKRYPVIIWLHGLGQDEQSFLAIGAPLIDGAIRDGRLPGAIVVAPGGNVSTRRPCVVPTHSGFINSLAGNFEDYLYCDVWGFVKDNFPIRPERQAHVLGGVSIGGAGAYHLAIKHREEFGVVCAIFPPLNLRWVDCHCNYFGDFDPNCWGWRTSVDNGHETIGKFYCVVRIPLRKVVYPLFGRGPDAIERLSAVNAIEMLDAYDVRPGQLEMFVAYGRRDEFNIDAQVDSFRFRACQRGLEVTAVVDPNGHHNSRTARRFAPEVLGWLGPRLWPFSADCLAEAEPVPAAVNP